jgi:ABC-2 type transport system permease protein
VLLLSLTLVVLLIAIAYALVTRRDLGAGLLPASLGPATAKPSLRSPLALAWRMHSGSLLGWTIVAALFGLFIGSIGQGMSNFVDTPEFRNWLASMGAQDTGEAFVFVGLYILGQIISAYALMTTLEMRSEEMDGRAEPLLATPVSRMRWAGSHLVFALGGPTIAILALGLAAGLSDGLGSGDVGRELPRLLARTTAILPAVWVLVGLTTALYGLLPRFATAASWGALFVFLMLELAWELQQINQYVFDVSPFAHVHWATQIHPASLIWLTLIAAVLLAAGLHGLRRRDMGR